MAVIDGSNRFQVLCHEQVARLSKVMEDEVPIHGRGNFPTLYVKLKNLVRLVKSKLADENIHVRDIRINGGAACYILGSGGSNDARPYNDLDLIFGMDLLGPNELQKIKTCVLGCLLDFLPKDVNKDKMTSCNLKEAYVQKLVKICSSHGDRWSLISLSNVRGRNVELKFVHSMKRQFEFSVDSFQIILDSLLTFYEVAKTTPMSEDFYPTVVAESVYGDFTEAWRHLNDKLIATRKPEEIRGGGLLKYCNLIVRDYQPAANVEIRELERYMCSRFFIDFSNIHQQRQKLESYLAYHFIGEEELKYDYLMTLYRVVDESTICLMGHERRQTLNLIYEFACSVLLENECKMHKLLQLQQFSQLSKLTVDQVYYGPVPPFTQYYGYSDIGPPPLPPPNAQFYHFCNRNNNAVGAYPGGNNNHHNGDFYPGRPPQMCPPCAMCPRPQIPPYLQCS